MSRMVQSNELFEQLKDALGLPKSTIRFELHCGVDECVTVKCEYYPEIGDTGRTKMVTAMQDYGLFVK